MVEYIFSIYIIIVQTAFDSFYPVEPYFGRFAGSFQDFGGNGIVGDLYFANSQALFLFNFSYDGQSTGERVDVNKDRVSEAKWWCC